MWLIGGILGVFIGASAAFARYRDQWGVYLGSIIGAVIVVWLLSARIPGPTGLIFVVTYILTYGVLHFGVLRQISLRGGGSAGGAAGGPGAGGPGAGRPGAGRPGAGGSNTDRPGVGPYGRNRPNAGGGKGSNRIIEHKDD